MDAVLYRFALEGENIIDTMFEGNDINPTYAEAEFTEGLHLTVVDFHDLFSTYPCRTVHWIYMSINIQDDIQAYGWDF